MATRKPSCTEWHQKQGKWMRTLGQRGCSIRLFQKRKGSNFYREVWRTNVGRSHTRCLFTTDRAEAERLGKAFLATLLQGPVADHPAEDITLRELCQRYSTENESFLDNTAGTRRDDLMHMNLLCSFFGDDRKVLSLTARDQAEYSTKRLAGGIEIWNNGERFVSQPCRARSVETDLALLHRMLRWATTIRRPTGKGWLEYHPLEGVRRTREKNPKRPVATWDRFQKVRTKLQELSAKGASDIKATARQREAARIRWLKVELALVLAEATGRRIGSIRQLRWDDIDFAGATIRWRAEADKKGKDWLVPIPATLVDELRTFQRRLGSVGGWIFAAEKNPAKPVDRYLLDYWLLEAETAAGVSKLDGGLWHPYRRKWATERKDRSLKDVAAAGGWKDVQTLLTCYQQADPETMLEVMSEPKKLRDRKAEGSV